MNMIIVRVGLAKERKKLSRPPKARTPGGSLSFAAVTLSRPSPGHVRERPESEVSLRVQTEDPDARVERESVAMKLARLVQAIGEPETPSDGGHTEDHDRKSAIYDDAADELEVKCSADDLEQGSARDSMFHFVTERDFT